MPAVPQQNVEQTDRTRRWVMSEVQRRVTAVLLIAIVAVAFVTEAHVQGVPPFDLLIANARIVDGTGNPWFHGDVAIRGGKIAAVGQLAGQPAVKRLDAGGHVVAPGFIDLMGTSDWTLLADSRAASKVTQGVTLMVAGEGSSIAPARIPAQGAPTRHGVTRDWRTLREFFAALEAKPATVNFATFVGVGGLRGLVVGRDDRPATAAELAEMERLVAEAMEDGALGVSSALMYTPGRFASTSELTALARVAARYGGIYATHQRSEADGIDASLDEVFSIARDAKIPAHIFHLKTMYRQNWGRMPHVIERIEHARAEGLDVTADAYPYIAARAGLSALLPPWVREGGGIKMVERLRDPERRAQIKRELDVPSPAWENEYYGAGGAEGFIISEVETASLAPLVGQRLSAIAAARGADPRDVIMDLLIEDLTGTAFISFIMDEPDVSLALTPRWTAFCIDSDVTAPDGPLSDYLPHPRAYGAFPRIFAKYVREDRVLSLEDAVRKATSLPAQILGLHDRGLIREGLQADLVIFDPATIQDRATFDRPHQYATGIDYVLVNGVVVVDHERITDARPGRVVRGSRAVEKKQ